MNVSKVMSSIPAIYQNTKKPTLALPENSTHIHTSKNVAYEPSQFAYEKLDALEIERSERADLSLYNEVAHYPEKSYLRSLFSFITHV